MHFGKENISALGLVFDIDALRVLLIKVQSVTIGILYYKVYLMKNFDEVMSWLTFNT